MFKFDYSRLRDTRRAYKLKQADIAELLACTPNTYRKIENGQGIMTIDRLLAFTQAFGDSPAKFFIKEIDINDK